MGDAIPHRAARHRRAAPLLSAAACFCGKAAVADPSVAGRRENTRGPARGCHVIPAGGQNRAHGGEIERPRARRAIWSCVLVKFIGPHAAYDRIDPETVSWRRK